VRVQPRTHFPSGEVDVGFGPLPRPPILLAIEARRRHPVGRRQIPRIADAEPPLFGCVHHEQAAERPERLAAEALLAFLVEKEHTASGIGRFDRSHESRESGANDDDISVHGIATLPRLPKLPKIQKTRTLACIAVGRQTTGLSGEFRN
jgi:hypothetical protein